MSDINVGHQYTLEISLLSDAIFSSGERERNLVQSRAQTDANGFVYFHAKSLKGQMKRQARWLLQQYIAMGEAGRSRAYEFLDAMDLLFGVSTWELERSWEPREFMQSYLEERQALGGLRQQGIMKLTHLELPSAVRSYFRDMVKEGHFSLHDLIEAQTHIRTEIQLQDGVVSDKMLTTYQSVKKGLTFQSQLYFDEDPSPVRLDLLRIVRSLERIGSNIHRGRGQIEAKLLIDGDDATARATRQGGLAG